MIQATNKFVWVVRDKNEDSEFFIPEQGREKPHSGQIVSVGGLVEDKKIRAAKGKKCLFHKGVGFEIEYQGIVYLLLDDQHIIGVDL